MASDEPARLARAWIAVLRHLTTEADRIQVHGVPSDETEGAAEDCTTLVSDGPDPVRAMLALIDVAEVRRGADPVSPGVVIEFLKGDAPCTSLSLHQGRAIHWPGADVPWVRLTPESADRLARWLAERGVREPLAELEREHRRERLWDHVVDGQRAVLPPSATDLLWEPGNEEARIAAFEALFTDPSARVQAALRVLGAAAPEWFVGLPLDRLLEPWLHDRADRADVVPALAEAAADPLAREGAARWLVHAGGAATLSGARHGDMLAALVRWALGHPVPRNRTEALELLGMRREAWATVMLREVAEGRVEVREPAAQVAELYSTFGEGTTFHLDERLVRGTGDAAFAALLLTDRGEVAIRPRVEAMMQTAGTADFHALALAMEAIERRTSGGATG